MSDMNPTDYGVLVIVFFLLLREMFSLIKHFGDRLLSKKNGVVSYNGYNGYKDVWALHFEKSLDKLTESIDLNTKVNTELAKEIHDILSTLSKKEESVL